MADNHAKEKEKLKKEVVEKVEQLKNAAEAIKLPDQVKKDLVMMLKRILCRMCLGSLDPTEIISDLCSLEEAVKSVKVDDIERVTMEMTRKFARSSSCTIVGDHCVRSTRELRLSQFPEQK